jgi:hypothetical protein
MSGTPLIELHGVVKAYQALRPLRIAELVIAATDRLALSGLDAGRPRCSSTSITGASVPDEGSVKVVGRDTRDIATDTEWLTSLDRFGIVTSSRRAARRYECGPPTGLPITIAMIRWRRTFAGVWRRTRRTSAWSLQCSIRRSAT